MGEEQGTLFSPEYNRSVRVEARPEKLTSDAGALVMREVMDRLGYSELIARHLTDPRVPGRVKHPHAQARMRISSRKIFANRNIKGVGAACHFVGGGTE